MTFRIVAVCALAIHANGCSAEPSGEWAGTVRDSAGVVVVDNPESGLWTAGTAWRLEEDLRIGVAERDAARQFDEIDDIAIDDAGRIFVLDGTEIRVFDREGAFMRAMGREGAGPGELARPSALFIGKGDTIFLPDTRNQRVQRFLADGSDAGSFPLLPTDGISLSWRIRPDGRLLHEVRTLPASDAEDGQILLLVRDGSGAVRDTLLALPVGEAMTIRAGLPQMTLFATEPMWTILTDGRILSGRNSEYRLEIRSNDGRTERIVRRPFERRPFPESEHRTMRIMLRQRFESAPSSQAAARMVESMEYADHYPVFAALFAGPGGTIWVQHAKDMSRIGPSDLEGFDVRAIGDNSYDVFDPEGRFLGVITTPRGFEPLRSDDDYVYGVGRDDMGVQHVIRLRHVRGAATAGS